MDRIKELLEFEGIAATDEQIKQLITSRNLHPDTVTDEQAAQIVKDLKGALTVAQSNKPASTPKSGKATKGRTKKLKNQVDQEAFNASITHLAHVAKSEIDTVTDTLQQGANAWKEDTKSEWKAIIRNTPVEAMNEMLDEVREEAADINSFRETTQQAVAIIFPLRNPSTTV